MRVIYDLQALATQKTGGVTRYFYELFSRIPRLGDVSVSLGGRYADSIYFLSDPKIVTSHRIRPVNDVRTPIGIRRLRKLLGLPRPPHPAIVTNRRILTKKLASKGFDLYHPTYYDVASSTAEVPYVVTVHDMIHEKFRRRFPVFDDETIPRKKRAVSGARKVIAVSESTKRDVVEILGIPEDRVVVTHHGSSLNFNGQAARDEARPDRPYILFVGSRAWYKNFIFFLHAILPVLRTHRDIVVVCAGGGDWSQEERAVQAAFNLADRVLLSPFVTDSELVAYYRHALFFAFPSLYEGFGIPILEAFNCGCPVAASNRSSLPEVAGEAALFFDPEDEESIADTVRRLILSEDLRNKFRDAGQTRARQFSWEATAAKTLTVYRQACQ